MSFVCEIKSEDRKKMVKRGIRAANSILKQAADWNNRCSFLCTTPHKSVSVMLCFEMAGFTNAQNWHTFLLPFEKDRGIRNSPLWGHFRLLGWFCFFFSGCWWHFCFSYGHAWQTSHRLEAMWSKPHTACCSRASVKAACSPCTEEFYRALLCSDLSVLTI